MLKTGLFCEDVEIVRRKSWDHPTDGMYVLRLPYLLFFEDFPFILRLPFTRPAKYL
jgi:hypothetical protein